MVRRLTEQYRPGDLVEIQFADDPRAGWLPAKVLRPDYPGLWVMTHDGEQWFVTNSRRIRSRPTGGIDSL